MRTAQRKGHLVLAVLKISPVHLQELCLQCSRRAAVSSGGVGVPEQKSARQTLARRQHCLGQGVLQRCVTRQALARASVLGPLPRWHLGRTCQCDEHWLPRLAPPTRAVR